MRNTELILMINIRYLGGKNFGDAVNDVFWKIFTNDNVVFNNKKGLHYLTTGSIMVHVNQNSIVFGTGFISENSDLGGGNYASKDNFVHHRPNSIIAVRGPLTRKKFLSMNIVCPENYGDPLILFPSIYIPKTQQETKKVGIIPHVVDKKNLNLTLLKENLDNKGYNTSIIDIEVGNNYEKILGEINECEYIVASSLHGVIMGLVYKKKTIFIELSGKLLGGMFKFNDFFGSIDVCYEPANVYDSSVLNNTINIDYEKLTNMGKNLIKICPFIDEKRKELLSKNYIEYYKG